VCIYRHGKGRLTHPDGSIFLGEFVDDKKHGIGMRKTKDNQYFYQIWREDELVSETPTDALNYDNFYWYDGTTLLSPFTHSFTSFNHIFVRSFVIDWKTYFVFECDDIMCCTEGGFSSHN
jgi:hypothetical protein